MGVTALTTGHGPPSAAWHGRCHRCPVSLSNVNAVVRALRAARAALAAVAIQVPRRRLVAMAALIVILVAFAWAVPLPTAVQLRDWATSVGPWFPLVFLAGHVVVTTFPFPRTAFSLAAGLMFGPVLGVSIAVAASTVSAVLAVLAIRALGWQLASMVRHPAVDRLDLRLRRRGWASVLSLRLIPAVPFAALNYAAGASSVRLVPYTVATFFGLLPGTIAVVVLGDALTGRVDPLLVLISAAIACVGLLGLVYENRLARRQRTAAPDARPADAVSG